MECISIALVDLIFFYPCDLTTYRWRSGSDYCVAFEL